MNINVYNKCSTNKPYIQHVYYVDMKACNRFQLSPRGLWCWSSFAASLSRMLSASETFSAPFGRFIMFGGGISTEKSARMGVNSGHGHRSTSLKFIDFEPNFPVSEHSFWGRFFMHPDGCAHSWHRKFQSRSFSSNKKPEFEQAFFGDASHLRKLRNFCAGGDVVQKSSIPKGVIRRKQPMLNGKSIYLGYTTPHTHDASHHQGFCSSLVGNPYKPFKNLQLFFGSPVYPDFRDPSLTWDLPIKIKIFTLPEESIAIIAPENRCLENDSVPFGF